MAARGYMGTETEYGIVVAGGQVSDHWLMSSPVIWAYGAQLLRDGFGVVGGIPSDQLAMIDEILRRGPMMANLRLGNGSRLYTDHAHPEYSTPECGSPREVVQHDAAGELILLRAAEECNRLLAERGLEVRIYKNTTMGGGGTSYGCHENYLIERGPWNAVSRLAPIHFISRQVMTGAGKVGVDHPREPVLDRKGKRLEASFDPLQRGRTFEVPFQLSERPDFFTTMYGGQTTYDRPIVNLRDESHADDRRYRRLHVIVGDANRSQVATYLKVGTTGLFLAMAQDGFLDAELGQLLIADPVAEFAAVSHDPSLQHAVLLDNGRTATALDIQERILELAHRYADERGLEVIGGDAAGRELLARWESVLGDLRTDPSRLNGVLDWPTKQALIARYRDRQNLPEDSSKLVVVDSEYSRLGGRLFEALPVPMERLIDPAQVEMAVHEPPSDTRAWFRGKIVDALGDAVEFVDWSELTVRTGRGRGQRWRVNLKELDRGTRDQWEAFFATRPSAQDLIAELQRRQAAEISQSERAPEPERGIE